VAREGRSQVLALAALMAGIVVAAALDNRLGWGTLLSVALAIYCHRLYRQPTSPRPPPMAPEEDELRPGWAVRLRREPTGPQRSAPVSRQEPSGSRTGYGPGRRLQPAPALARQSGGTEMSATWSVGEGRPMCQAVGCRQLAAPVAV
jgi:hypothetical protein